MRHKWMASLLGWNKQTSADRLLAQVVFEYQFLDDFLESRAEKL